MPVNVCAKCGHYSRVFEAARGTRFERPLTSAVICKGKRMNVGIVVRDNNRFYVWMDGGVG